MSKFKITCNGRKYIVLDHMIVYVRPTLFGKRVKKDHRGYDTPASLEFPVHMVTRIKWSEGWLFAGPSLTITCAQGLNDPWRSRKDEKPWKLTFGGDREDRGRNRALHLAWMLHLANRQDGRNVLDGTLPDRAALIPTRGEQAMAKAADGFAKLGKRLESAIDKVFAWFGGSGVRYPAAPAAQPMTEAELHEVIADEVHRQHPFYLDD